MHARADMAQVQRDTGAKSSMPEKGHQMRRYATKPCAPGLAPRRIDRRRLSFYSSKEWHGHCNAQNPSCSRKPERLDRGHEF